VLPADRATSASDPEQLTRDLVADLGSAWKIDRWTLPSPACPQPASTTRRRGQIADLGHELRDRCARDHDVAMSSEWLALATQKDFSRASMS